MSFKTIQYGLEYLKKNKHFRWFQMFQNKLQWIKIVYNVYQNSKTVFNVSFQTVTILNFFHIFRIFIQKSLTFTGIKNFWIHDDF